METKTHTPVPWTFETVPTQVGHCHKIMPIHACIYVDHRNAGEKDPKTEEALANAAFICRAVNNFDQMLETLKLALNEWPERFTPVHAELKKSISRSEAQP